ncbi:ATP-grasp domain-containing protein [Chitinophagaceae bacterium MMS25-I14]
MNVQWVVQSNLTALASLEALRLACEGCGIKFLALEVIPFTDRLPDFDRSLPSIVYGTTTFNELAGRDAELSKGLFFDAETFSIENYFAKWGRHMLNYGATVTTFNKLMTARDYSPDKLFFIRPDDDSKSFAGEVKRFDEIEAWFNQLRITGSTQLWPDSKIIVSEPYNIHFEWRLWIVNKKVIAASLYREYFRLKKAEGCPESVIAFAEERCREYTPHDVFVMDVCLCGDEYYIVECNCVNGAGFYAACIRDVVCSVTDYFISVFKITSDV